MNGCEATIDTPPIRTYVSLLMTAGMIALADLSHYKIKDIVVEAVGSVVNARVRFPSDCGNRPTISKALWEGCGNAAIGERGPTFQQAFHRAVRRGRFHSPGNLEDGRVLEMGMRNRRKEVLNRMENKTLDSKFLSEITQGLNCSPFEAEAVLQVVKDVYLPWFDCTGNSVPPGKVTLVAVSADEPAGKPIVDCEKVTVCLTVHGGIDDDKLLKKGAAMFRRARIPILCQEALSQGGLLTREDLAHRVFFVSTRTITRDLKILREESHGPVIPIRSNIRDIGPVLTHRNEIVRLALEGKTTTEICRIMRHSPEAVANYISTFVRCAQLVEQGMQEGQIAFLLRRGGSLIRKYIELLHKCKQDSNMDYHLQELKQIGLGKKTSFSGGPANG